MKDSDISLIAGAAAIGGVIGTAGSSMRSWMPHSLADLRRTQDPEIIKDARMGYMMGSVAGLAIGGAISYMTKNIAPLIIVSVVIIIMIIIQELAIQEQ